jgi:uncharacterized SAM-binding protein YcdF (DUF218 family)
VVEWLLRQVVDPAVIWSILLILILFFQPVRQKVFIPFVVITLLGANSLITYLAISPLERYAIENFPYADQTKMAKINCKQYQGVIALGGVIPNADYNPKLGIQITQGVERVTQPVALYKQCPNLDLIFTSFGPESGAQLGEAQLAKEFWIAMGVAAGDIKIENESHNSYENAVNTKALLGNKGRYLLVTSAAHMKRAHTSFTKVGMKTDPIAVDYLFTIRPKPYHFAPLNNLAAWRSLTHEYLGLIYYQVSKF